MSSVIGCAFHSHFFFILTVKYTVEVYTPDKSARKVNSLTVRINGKEKETKDQTLKTTTEKQGYDMYLLHSAKHSVTAEFGGVGVHVGIEGGKLVLI